MKNIINKLRVAIAFLVVSFGLYAQGEAFSSNAILKLNINYLHAKAAWDNQNAVANFNITTANNTSNNKPEAQTVLVVESVDDAKATAIFNQIQSNFATMQSVAGLNIEDAIVRSAVPVPPGSAVSLTSDGAVSIVPPHAPVAVAQPVDPVGGEQGNGVYGCVTGDSTKDGKKVGNSRGVFQKHLQQTPFGFSCSWSAIALVSEN